MQDFQPLTAWICQAKTKNNFQIEKLGFSLGHQQSMSHHMSVLPQWKVQSVHIPCGLIPSRKRKKRKKKKKKNERIIDNFRETCYTSSYDSLCRRISVINPWLVYFVDEDQAELCACLSSTSTRFWAQTWARHRLESFLRGENILFPFSTYEQKTCSCPLTLWTVQAQSCELAQGVIAKEWTHRDRRGSGGEQRATVSPFQMY